MGHRLTVILAAEYQGVLGRSWNSERPLVFSHVFLTKTLGVLRAKEIRAQITRHIDLWNRGIHAGLVGGAEAEGATWEGRDASGREKEYEAVAQSYHETVLSGKLRQATYMEGGGCLLSEDQCTKTG